MPASLHPPSADFQFQMQACHRSGALCMLHANKSAWRVSFRKEWGRGRSTSSTKKRLRVARCAAMSAIQEFQQDFGVVGAVVAGAYLWVQGFELLTRFNVLDQKLSRKLVHMTTGPLFMLSWPLFSSSSASRYICSLVPLANAVRLLILGLGLRTNEGVVKSMSRDGDAKELLRGPLYYVAVLFISTVCFWRDSPVGMIALSVMCGGDGIADIIGRKFGREKLPYNEKKSWAGSTAMFVCGTALSFASIYYFTYLGFYALDPLDTLARVTFISLAATLVESLPITSSLDDNLMVPTTVMLLGSILF
ncbi:phytol kinase 1, chloroplastic-like [Selaginella moellendorffii]|uniref:phytol kinase 1, chloroplastic-like n=1 Tax=Selaginella moellendorffii TaxID=88036 RepID=UPI000D1CA200|nr:phytol kinase 1, chloroplastic-like [Selaginella moellendorffii]XP_024531190.1 phytol kinase 1, chloroplastic-like [Selaginella moellendorffii]XP_024531191.1 phytol kinase 1, chloroplastic-like [Selaginella moellendorffii]|eukprot:XP_024531188.1 phytol kinase 1, chloroplastic-like [Selaginella moellendorffii]